MEKEHSKKCASFHCKYSGDMRNIKFYADQMQDCDCDGYHTFTELYEHRITLWIALCRQLVKNNFFNPVWRSEVNGDGTKWDGWFILGFVDDNGKQITYHLPIEKWNETSFAETIDKAPDFDGHTSDDVLERLKKL